MVPLPSAIFDGIGAASADRQSALPLQSHTSQDVHYTAIISIGLGESLSFFKRCGFSRRNLYLLQIMTKITVIVYSTANHLPVLQTESPRKKTKVDARDPIAGREGALNGGALLQCIFSVRRPR